MRLRSDFWVAAYIRRCDVEGVVAVLRRRGAAEAGAVYVKHDRLDGTAALYGPAPQGDTEEGGIRRFLRLHKEAAIGALDCEARLRREIDFDPDIWIVEVESRGDAIFLEMVE